MLFIPVSLWNLIKVVLLCINALAVLNEERFLRRVGFGYRPEVVAQASVKAQIINLLHAVRTLMRIPLIALNITTIALSLLAG
ncbi:ier3ip1 [Acrasis kona]|uniref:Ier3ip1 n=1 Tax=Acrasis kona TaxID=1008807 RepID=A0AAW2YIQ4_9EUKA